MDLTFQVALQCSFLQHRTLLPSPVPSTTGRFFCFGSVSSFFLELFLYSSPVAYWAPTDQGISSFSVISFCLFILLMGPQGKNNEVVCHSFLRWTSFVRTLHHDLSILGGPTWHGSYFHWVRQSCGPCDQFSVIVVFILSALWWIRIRGYESSLKGETDCGGNGLVLLAGPCSVNI